MGYGVNPTDTIRNIFVGTVHRIATGDYTSKQFTVSLGAGKPMSLSDTAFFTPDIGLTWLHVTGESYTETGAGDVNLTMNLDDTDAILGSLAFRVHSVSDVGNGYRFLPEFRAGIQYDFVGDESESTSTFTGGGRSFTTVGTEVKALSGTVGLGVALTSNTKSFTLGYNASFKDGHMSHSGLFEAKILF